MSEDTIILRDGAVVSKALAVDTYLKLQSLAAQDSASLFDLVMTCQYPDVELFGQEREQLVRMGLIEDGSGQPTADVRRIVQNAVVGEDFSLTLQNPVQGAK